MNHVYKKLRKHLNSMPVGFPKTFSGIEYKILQKVFTPEYASIALVMDYKAETAEDIFNKLKNISCTREEVATLLDDMVSYGAIFLQKVGDVKKYALVPLVVGMHEFQTDKMSQRYYRDIVSYFKKGYAIDYLTTSIPQMRVVPIEKSVKSETKINTYDEIRRLIENTPGKLTITDCICKKGQMHDHEPCKQSKTNETCIGLMDYSDNFIREGWGREISKDEALEIIVQCEKDGLIIQTANEQNPQFICACCSCCCGVLSMMKNFPRPRDFAAANFIVKVDEEPCIGCGKCLKRCNLNALTIVDGKAVIDTGKCIGCGLCVSQCKPEALQLLYAKENVIPPLDTAELYETIRREKKNKVFRLFTLLKALLGFKT